MSIESKTKTNNYIDLAMAKENWIFNEKLKRNIKKTIHKEIEFELTCGMDEHMHLNFNENDGFNGTTFCKLSKEK